MSNPLPYTGTVHTVTGRGRGKQLGYPTLNIADADIPKLDAGIYGGFASWDGVTYKAAVHLGARPTFDDTRSCEVHIIDEDIPEAPVEFTLKLVERIRDVHQFSTKEALKEAIAGDIEEIRGILARYEENSPQS